MTDSLVRCPWCPPADDLYVRYHDEEWGVPVYDGRQLFEMLNLEGAQAGLSWRTVLGRRDGYRRVFDGFDIRKLAAWDDDRMAKALLDPGIIRNRLKVRAVVRNARAVIEHFDGDLDRFSAFLWDFVDGAPRKNAFEKLGDFPSQTSVSDRMSKELKKIGFTFVGSTICYAFMQAVGMVNDHTVDCFRYNQS
jgi:DNA-3-methyladenine glycosylase I